MRLLWLSRRVSIRLYVLIWVAINVVGCASGTLSLVMTVILVRRFTDLLHQASQIGLATLGLTYNVNTADKIVPTRPGTVAAPDLTTIQTTKVVSNQTDGQAINAIRYTANRYEFN